MRSDRRSDGELVAAREFPSGGRIDRPGAPGVIEPQWPEGEVQPRPKTIDVSHVPGTHGFRAGVGNEVPSMNIARPLPDIPSIDVNFHPERPEHGDSKLGVHLNHGQSPVRRKTVLGETTHRIDTP